LIIAEIGSKRSFENVFQAVSLTSRRREGFLIALENSLWYKALALFGTSTVGCGDAQNRSSAATITILADAAMQSAGLSHIVP
jgi:hypothetical protein